jgi:nucleoside-diphosphate-sugar epimerase
MRVLVTGAAGFIGSSLVDALLERGDRVVGVDMFTGYYDPGQKRRNLDSASASPGFELEDVDLSTTAITELLHGVEVVFHLAGQPGVRQSWGPDFEDYVRHNIIATQRLLEACRHHGVGRFVNSSSSSVYGNAERFPTSEIDAPAPVSPYGVTKLAAEHLCSLYGTNFGLPTVSLRYFTVFGPRQRPDMAMHRIIESAITGKSFPQYGDGSQVRDFTYVSDVVTANLLAATAEIAPGTVLNIGGGAMTSLSDVISSVERLVGRSVPIESRGSVAGDAKTTGADTTRAHEALGWRPEVSVDEGLQRQIAWHREHSRGV